MMITLKNVTKEYNKGNIGLEDVSLDIAKGEFVFIVGKSGSGKTTLMKLLQKELDVTSGQIIVNGQDYKKLTQRNLPKFRRQMGMVFQDFRLLKDRTIFENVAFAQQVVEVPHRYIKRQVENMLEMVGLKDRMNAFPNELSGGEQQRVGRPPRGRQRRRGCARARPLWRAPPRPAGPAAGPRARPPPRRARCETR